MVEPERDEGENGQPNTNDLGRELSALDAQVTSQTHQPVASDTAEEDVVEVGGDLFLGCEGDDGGLEGFSGEDVAIFHESVSI